jgi:hypothetical protein
MRLGGLSTGPVAKDRLGALFKRGTSAFGRSILAHKIAKISKGSGVDVLAANSTVPDAHFPSTTMLSSRSLRPFVPIPFQR